MPPAPHTRVLGVSTRRYCRVRPLLSTELNAGYRATLEYHGKKVEIKRRGKLHRAFKFDALFGPTAPQHTVFTDVARLLQSAVDGHNVSIISFGATGSGKTYTMFGPELQSVSGAKGLDGAASGIAPRVASELFRILRLQRTPQWTLGPEDSIAAAGVVGAGGGGSATASAAGDSNGAGGAGAGAGAGSGAGGSMLSPLHTSLPLDFGLLNSPGRATFHSAYTTRVRISMFDIRGPYVSDVLRSTDTPAAPLALVPGEDGIMYVEGGTTVEVASEAEMVTVLTTGLRHRWVCISVWLCACLCGCVCVCVHWASFADSHTRPMWCD